METRPESLHGPPQTLANSSRALGQAWSWQTKSGRLAHGYPHCDCRGYLEAVRNCTWILMSFVA